MLAKTFWISTTPGPSDLHWLRASAFFLTSVSISWDSKRVTWWILWADVPVVPDSFHPCFSSCFHRSKRADGKQRTLILPFAHNHNSLCLWSYRRPKLFAFCAKDDRSSLHCNVLQIVLTDWTLRLEQSLILHCVTRFYIRVKYQLLFHNILEPV